MSETNNFFKITFGSFKFIQLFRRILYSCTFVHLITLEFLAVPPALSYTHRITCVGRFKCFGPVPPALSYTHRITFVGRFKCIGRMACALP